MHCPTVFWRSFTRQYFASGQTATFLDGPAVTTKLGQREEDFKFKFFKNACKHSPVRSHDKHSASFRIASLRHPQCGFHTLRVPMHRYPLIPMSL